MTLFTNNELEFSGVLSQLAYCNPFLEERIELERVALGDEFVKTDPVWSFRADMDEERANINALVNRVSALTQKTRTRLRNGQQATESDLIAYSDLVLFLLYHCYRDRFFKTIDDTITTKATLGKIAFYRSFNEEAQYFLSFPRTHLSRQAINIPHIFACFFQVARAFVHIFNNIVGGSMAAAKLRAAVWQSIFTYDMRRYHRILFKKMGDMSTLICGPSGTGKELVARAIGMSRYIPFDEKNERFTQDFSLSFHALNLSALSPTLIESELFGHRKGAFTGSAEGRAGWLEICGSLGTVFLDEIGEINTAIQVKLLRVLQSRTFQRIGESQDRRFEGKIIAATNRDLAIDMQAGHFRQDLYYRLCSDIITTPSLQEQLRESPEELPNIVLFITKNICGDGEVDGIAQEVTTWIETHLPKDYAWLGNFREMEQCVRNILIRKRYNPRLQLTEDFRNTLRDEIWTGSLSADELLQRYCTIIYAKTGNYQEAARRLQLDRRTVKKYINAELLEELRSDT